MDRVAQFQELVRRQPENELFRFSLAQALQAAERGDEAVEHYRYCILKKPDWMMAHILLGKLLLALGQREAARKELQIALDLAVQQSHEEPEHELRGLLTDL